MFRAKAEKRLVLESTCEGADANFLEKRSVADVRDGVNIFEVRHVHD